MKEFLVEAITLGQKEGSPFTAIVLDDKQQAIAKAANTGKKDGPLAHAEMNAINMALQTRKDLRKCTLISTCEPCPMCIGAIIWSKIETVYFGYSIAEISRHVKQINISSSLIVKESFYQMKSEKIYGFENEIEQLFMNTI